jgi:integrase
MTFRVKKRGETYRLEGRAGRVGDVRVRRGAGERERIRLSLGTHNGDAAHLLHGKIERALAEGPDSTLWRNLRSVLPADTFTKLAAIAGHVPDQKAAPECRWTDLVAKFKRWMSQRVALDKLRESTRERYLQTCAAFGEFLGESGIADLGEIKRATIEDFKSWQLARILTKKNSRGGRGVVLDVAILHRIFGFAIDDCELLLKNPVRLDGRPGDRPEFGAQPFTADQLAKLRQAAGGDMLAFLLLRHTGFRGSDAVGLRLGEIDWDTHEINRLTVKRRKRVVLPIHSELFFALEAERDRRGPDADPEERLLMNPATGRPLTRPRLYQRMLALGKRAGVLDSHPHRFRDTFAVDFLAKGGSPYDVAKLLGDTVETIERHYAPFVRELRERARGIMETAKGLDIAGTPRALDKMPEGKPN